MNNPDVIKSPEDVNGGSLKQPCYTDPTDDPAYQEYVNKCAEQCTCQPPHQRPCDGVLAGGICDQMFEDMSLNEPDTDMLEE